MRWAMKAGEWLTFIVAEQSTTLSFFAKTVSAMNLAISIGAAWRPPMGLPS
jgi:hypothetical protein